VTAPTLVEDREMNAMMSGGMDMMMTGMALVWILVILVIVLVGAPAVKYLFFHKRKD
jgi:hypothetical protein